MAAELRAGESGLALKQQELAMEMGGGAVPGGVAVPERTQEGETSAESAQDHSKL